MMADVVCDYRWETSGIDDPARTKHHRCWERPGHRGGHVCPCGARSVLDRPAGHEGPHAPRTSAPDLVVDYSVPTAARRFILDRVEDPSGVSGLGIVAEGVEFTDGSVAVRWLGERPSTAAWGSIEDVEAIHGHGGKTQIRWADEVDEP